MQDNDKVSPEENNIDTTDEFDEIISGPGFILAQEGRFIYKISTIESNEDYQALLEAIAASKDEILKSVEQQVQELEDTLLRFNPFDIIGNVSFSNAVLDAETYKEYSHKGNDAYTEYLTLLYLTKPFEAYSKRRIEPIPGGIIQEIQDKTRNLFHNTVAFLAAKDVDPTRLEGSDRLIRLRHEILSRSLFVRYPAYFHHLVDVLQDMFMPLQDELRTVLGFNLNDALILAEGIETLVTQRLVVRRDEARRFEVELRKVIKAYRKKRRKIGNFPPELCEQLASMTPSEAAQNIMGLAITWTFFALGDTLSFTVADLADETGLDVERVTALLDRMSLGFGEVEDRYRIPAPTHPLMIKPLIRHEGKYFCPVINLIYTSLRPMVETFLKPNSPESIHNEALWERYDRTRANYLEKTALVYLSNALSHATTYHNLKYQITEDGQLKNGQLDGLLLLDTTLFLIEAKAGSLSLPARRGARKRMVEEIGELVEEAYSQALRAKRYIQESERPVFYLEDETKIEIPKDVIDQIFLITVTLDDLDAFITNLYQLQDLGFLAEGDFPWAVSLTDLRVVTELTEFSSQFVHYLKRRYRLNQQGRVQANDELDWFGHYLQEGLFFDKMLEGDEAPDIINLVSYTTIFDDYYFFVTGQRKSPVPKPIQPMPEIMRQILTELDTNHPTHYLDAAGVLLDMDGETREQFAEHINAQRNRTLEDRRFHDFSIPFLEPGFGFTYMFSPLEKAWDLPQRINGYCALKKYQTKSNLWVGFGCIAYRPGWIHYLIVLKGPWSYDEEMEKLVAENLRPLPPVQNVDHTKHPKIVE